MIEPDATKFARKEFDAWREQAAINRFDCDSFLKRLLRRHLGDDLARHETLLHDVAEQSGAALAESVAVSNSDEHLPALRRHDADGRCVEAVEFHPAYHAVGRVFWKSGVLSRLAEPGNNLLCGALSYLLDQNGEAGHACPVACTAGAIKLLQQFGSDVQKQEHLPRLLDPDYDRRIHAAQFVTEIQGGSDVGSNACRAIPEPDLPGHFRISGEKWFCSVADAGLFIVSARPEGAPKGTRGLGLFLVPRMVHGRPNGFTLRRLKSKLGTRSMATGEIEFNGALAQPIGPLDAGFRSLVSIVLDTSRVHNAIAACGLMRRAFSEARAFASHRTAFGRRITDFPAVREILARMRLRGMAGLAASFRSLRASDQLDSLSADHGDAAALAASRRIDVTIMKIRTSLAATMTTREGIEIFGGNGTIEDFSVLPRLYRDAIVIESWEGTHNTLCAQVLRDFASRNMHIDWLARIGADIDAVEHQELNEARARARAMLEDVARRVEALIVAAASDLDAASASVRHVTERMSDLVEFVELLAQAGWDLAHGPDSGARETIDALTLHGLCAAGHASLEERPGFVELCGRLARY